jgi:hypothetical protein
MAERNIYRMRGVDSTERDNNLYQVWFMIITLF